MTTKTLFLIGDTKLNVKKESAYDEMNFITKSNGSNSSETLLTLSGDGNIVTIGNDLTVTGNLTVSGTTTTVDSTTVSIKDPIFEIGDDTTDDNLDRGIKFKYNNGTTQKIGFFGYDDSEGNFTFLVDATDNNSVFSGSKASLNANLTGTVNTATQNSITTMTGLTTVGSSGNTTTFNGEIVVSEGITGDVTGDLTGTVNTATQNSITTMTGLTTVGSSGNTTTFNGEIAVSEGITGDVTGDLTGTVNTATQNSITTMTGLTTVGSSGNTTTFNGELVVSEGITGDVTGNVTGSVFSEKIVVTTQQSATPLAVSYFQSGITNESGIIDIYTTNNASKNAVSYAKIQYAYINGVMKSLLIMEVSNDVAGAINVDTDNNQVTISKGTSEDALYSIRKTKHTHGSGIFV